MLGALEPLQKIFKWEKLQTSSAIFTFNHQVSALLFIFCSLIVTAPIFTSSKIECVQSGASRGRIEAVNSFCSTASLFIVERTKEKTLPTLQELDQMKRGGHLGVVGPGIEPLNRDTKRVSRQNYLFLPVAILLQGLSFYMLRAVWKLLESGRVKAVIQNPTETDPKLVARKIIIKFNELVGRNQRFAVVNFVMELCSLLHTISIIYVNYILLGYGIVTYVYDVLKFRISSEPVKIENIRYDPMDWLFPPLAKCRFLVHGVGGGIQNGDVLCSLPLNKFYDKIFFVLMSWLGVLLILNSLNLIHRSFQILFKRYRLLTSAIWLDQSWEKMKYVIGNMAYCDYLLLSQIMKNIDLLVGNELFSLLADQEKRAKESKKDVRMKRKAQKKAQKVKRMKEKLESLQRENDVGV